MAVILSPSSLSSTSASNSASSTSSTSDEPRSRRRVTRGSDTSELRIQTRIRKRRSSRSRASKIIPKAIPRVKTTVRRSRAQPQRRLDDASEESVSSDEEDKPPDFDLDRLARRTRERFFSRGGGGAGGRGLGDGFTKSMTMDRLARTLRSDRRDVGGSGRKIPGRTGARGDNRDVYVTYARPKYRRDDSDDRRSSARSRMETWLDDGKDRRRARVMDLPKRDTVVEIVRDSRARSPTRSAMRSDSQTMTRSVSTREATRTRQPSGLSRSRTTTARTRDPDSSRTAVESPLTSSPLATRTAPGYPYSPNEHRRRASAGGGFFSIFRSGAAAPPKPEPIVQCHVCLSDDFLASKTTRLACGHRMCHACLKRLFSLSVTDPAHMPPRCCTSEHIPLRHVDQFFNDRFKILWNRKYQESTAKDRLYCPARGCGEWIKAGNVHLDRYSGKRYGVCKRCKTRVCVRCNAKWHGRRECPKDEETLRFVEVAKKAGWQRCYNCKAMVELKEGCNHMTCRCRAEFCMQCGLPWKTCSCLWFNHASIPDADDRLLHMNVPEDVRVELPQDHHAHAPSQRRPMSAHTRRLSSFLSRTQDGGRAPIPVRNNRPITDNYAHIEGARIAARRAQHRFDTAPTTRRPLIISRSTTSRSSRSGSSSGSGSDSGSTSGSSDSDHSALAHRRPSYRRPTSRDHNQNPTSARRRSVIVDDAGNVITTTTYGNRARDQDRDVGRPRERDRQRPAPFLPPPIGMRATMRAPRERAPPPAAMTTSRNATAWMGGLVRSLSQGGGSAAGGYGGGRPSGGFGGGSNNGAAAATPAAGMNRGGGGLGNGSPVTWSTFTRNLRRGSTGMMGWNGFPGGRGGGGAGGAGGSGGREVRASALAGLGPEAGRKGQGRVGAWLAYVVDDPVAVEGN